MTLIKLVEEYKETYPVALISDCFGATFYRWKSEGEKPYRRDDIVEAIEQLCMANHYIYGYRIITRLLKKRYNLVVNHKKVYRIMKAHGWTCRTRKKKAPNLTT